MAWCLVKHRDYFTLPLPLSLVLRNYHVFPPHFRKWKGNPFLGTPYRHRFLALKQFASTINSHQGQWGMQNGWTCIWRMWVLQTTYTFRSCYLIRVTLSCMLRTVLYYKSWICYPHPHKTFLPHPYICSILEIFLFTTASRTALGPTQPPIQWVPGALSLGVKWPGCEADHSPPSSAEAKNAWSYTSTPPIRLHGVVLS
jgi:hypothetical protein